jgi:hypothetical protein
VLNFLKEAKLLEQRRKPRRPLAVRARLIAERWLDQRPGVHRGPRDPGLFRDLAVPQRRALVEQPHDRDRLRIMRQPRPAHAGRPVEGGRARHREGEDGVSKEVGAAAVI